MSSIQIHATARHDNTRYNWREFNFAVSNNLSLNTISKPNMKMSYTTVFIVITRQQPREALRFIHKQNMNN